MVLFSGAPSLTRGRVCLLYMLLGLASAVILGSESLGTRDYILMSQIWCFPFRRLLRLAGSRWRYSNPPPHGYNQFKVTLRLTVSQSVSLGIEPIRGSWPDTYFSLTITVLFLWGALSDERMGLFFVYAAGPRQCSLSLVRVLWDSWPYFTVSDLRLRFSSPLTTRRVTVEVLDPASTRVISINYYFFLVT
jgi:hypothetical protein